MNDFVHNPDDLIYALATPRGESALAVVRTSGEGAVEKIASLFSAPEAVSRSAGYSLHHGTLSDPGTGEPVDEVVLAVYRAPKSYTGQDAVEIFCHGSLPGLELLFDVLRRTGFRPAGGGEFTLRAFLSGRMDLTQAEAVYEIITAKTRKAQSLALHRLSGSVFRRIRDVKTALVDLLSAVELQLDYPEDEAESYDLPETALLGAEKALENLVAGFRTGRIFQEGVSVAIAGRTNAGKSSLFNLFLREDRSIVSETHGTTRDYIESWISIGGIPVRLFDTAGLRQPDTAVEEEGIRRSRHIVGNAALVLYLVDSTRGLDEEDRVFLLEQGGGRGEGKPGMLFLWNKIDAGGLPAPEGFLPVSTLTGEGFAELERRMKEEIIAGPDPEAGEPVIDSERQRDLVTAALAALNDVRQGIRKKLPLDVIALDLKRAVDALGEITGEVTTADILDNMFSRFCVGK